MFWFSFALVLVLILLKGEVWKDMGRTVPLACEIGKGEM
jgi:predicted membrane metal-binding protein